MAALSFLLHSLIDLKAEQRRQKFRRFTSGLDELSPRSKIINDETRRFAEVEINALNLELLCESQSGSTEWHTNSNGSTICIVLKRSKNDSKEKTSTNTTTSGRATISVTTTTATDEAISTISHRIIVKPSSCLSSIGAIVRKTMVKVKALTAFGQGNFLFFSLFALITIL